MTTDFWLREAEIGTRAALWELSEANGHSALSKLIGDKHDSDNPELDDQGL
jgi:hypothetical protein